MGLIVSAIVAAALDHGLDPKLMLAMARIESGLNPNAVGRSHGEIGLFQLRPEYHECASFDPEENAQCAAQYLKRLKRRFARQYPKSWFVFYNWGPNARLPVHPTNTRYFKKVYSALKGE